jgi:hypothetical protein
VEVLAADPGAVGVGEADCAVVGWVAEEEDFSMVVVGKADFDVRVGLADAFDFFVDAAFTYVASGTDIDAAWPFVKFFIKVMQDARGLVLDEESTDPDLGSGLLLQVRD